MPVGSIEVLVEGGVTTQSGKLYPAKIMQGGLDETHRDDAVTKTRVRLPCCATRVTLERSKRRARDIVTGIPLTNRAVGKLPDYRIQCKCPFLSRWPENQFERSNPMASRRY